MAGFQTSLFSCLQLWQPPIPRYVFDFQTEWSQVKSIYNMLLTSKIVTKCITAGEWRTTRNGASASPPPKKKQWWESKIRVSWHQSTTGFAWHITRQHNAAYKVFSKRSSPSASQSGKCYTQIPIPCCRRTVQMQDNMKALQSPVLGLSVTSSNFLHMCLFAHAVRSKRVCALDTQLYCNRSRWFVRGVQ